MRLKDIEARNAAGKIMFGYVEADFLEAPPFVMFNNNDCSVAHALVTDGVFEPTSLRLWCSLARTATSIADIGAYTGIYSLAAAGLRPDITIHAFEPNPFTCARLRVNKVANELWNIEEHAAGIGQKDGVAELKWRRKGGASLSSTASFGMLPDVPAEQIESASVPIRRLDSAEFGMVLGARPLLKIDVEGAELWVMNGLGGVLAAKPDIILETFSPEACAAINAMVQPLGYGVYHIREGEGRLERRAALEACDPRGRDFNQVLTTRPVNF